MKATIERAVAITEATFTIAPSERSQAAGVSKSYTVTVQSGRAQCDCRGFEYTGHCYHTDKILEAIRELVTVPQPDIPLKKREQHRTCLYCHREYTCWATPLEPDGLCSEKCEKALNTLYGEPEIPLAERGTLVGTQPFSLLR